MTAIVTQDEQPISRTYQYRKITKPLLERKRRARINRCLDELKEILVGALQADGENVSRLEKADILELTCRHLHKLRRNQQMSESSSGERFKAGFVHCANEVSKYITVNAPVAGIVDVPVNARLVNHLEQCFHRMEETSQKIILQQQQQQQVIQAPGYLPVPVTPLMSPIPVMVGNGGIPVPVNYTPPSSPKYAYLPGSRGSPVSEAGSLSPIPPAHAHANHPFQGHRSSALDHYQQQQNQQQDEPLNLSENVWRPW